MKVPEISNNKEQISNKIQKTKFQTGCCLMLAVWNLFVIWFL